MAKESMKARERKRAKMVAKYAEKRAALKAAGDYEGLQKLPKNSCPVRLHNRLLSGLLNDLAGKHRWTCVKVVLLHFFLVI